MSGSAVEIGLADGGADKGDLLPRERSGITEALTVRN